jgi:hypothetical protein
LIQDNVYVSDTTEVATMFTTVMANWFASVVKAEKLSVILDWLQMMHAIVFNCGFARTFLSVNSTSWTDAVLARRATVQRILFPSFAVVDNEGYTSLTP